ncbi:MAG: InlB B-repeat-containing protein, partial [Lachnospiraceae bacterium]|nr:InlB B-repeat-containing protein [Lachnospiraceae bacterium]
MAVIMAIVMSLSSLSGCSFQKESKDPTSQETTTVDATESSSDPEVTPESTPSPITRLTNVFQADENSTYYEIKFALPENTTKEEADMITLPKTMTIPEGSLLYSVQGAQKDDYSFNGWYYDAALTQRADGGDVVDHNMTLYPSFVPLQNFDDEVRINYISALDVEPDFKIEVIAFGLTEDEVRERIKVTNLSKVNGAEEFVLERVGSDVAGNAESAKINEILKRVEKAGYDVTSVKISQLTKLLTKDDFAQLGLSMPTAYDSEVDATINLKSIISYDEADLPQTHYIVRPAGNRWNRGDMHQVEILNTDGLRFYRDNEVIGQYVIYYNITVHQDNFNNMRLASGMIFLPIKEVSGVSMDRGLFRVKGNTDGEMSVSENDDSGILTYSGTKEIHAGDTVAVYDGKLKSSGAVDGSVGYFKITEVLGGGKYAYEGADYKDVVFVPDMIPVKNDGSFKDGKILITKDQLDFSGDIYQTLGLSKDTVVEAGDFLVIYNGDLSKADSIALVGYGCVTSVQSAEDGLQVRYDVVSEEKVKESADMYMHVDNVDLQLTEDQLQEIAKVFEDDMRDSGFAEKASQYMCDVITLGDDAILPDSTYADSLTEIKFQRADGSEISLEEVRELAGSGRVSVELPPKLYFGPSLGLQHFDGQTGLRLEASVEVEVTIELNESGVIKINAVALLEVEFALGLSIKFETDWRMWYCFPYIYDIGGHVGLTAGVYVGFGVTVTIQTQGKDDDDDDPDDALDEFASNKDLDDDKKKDFGGKISNLGKGLSSIAKMSKLGSDGLGISTIPGTKTEKSKKEHVKTGKESNGEDTQDGHNSVGGSFEEKYANFLQDSDAEYVDLVRRNLLSVELGSDPFHILVLELDINLVVSFKLNVMLGASITYGNAKQISADFTIFHPGAESTVGDLETPNFQADFFIFGNIGIRVGLEFELRVGAISAKLCSLGVTAEIGVYVEFFGYFYVAFKWESGKGSSTEMFGSMLLELGLYLDIGFRAQLGNGKLQKDIDIYNVRFPLLSLGTEYTPLDFDIEEDSEDLVLDIQKGGSIQVPDELFDIQFLKISTGDISTDNMDRTMSVYNKDNTPFVSNGLTLRQSDEQYFHITFKPLGKDYAEPTEKDKLKGGFLYNPEDNKIYAKPSSETTDELWGEFTFKWYQGGPAKTDALLNYGAGFGLNTREISRTVYVHWKGIPTVTKANLYFINETGDKELSKATENGTLFLFYAHGKENKYYDYKESIDFHGFDGVAYYLDAQKMADAYPGYRIGAAKETYNEEAVDYYANRFREGNSELFTELFRMLFYDAEIVEDDPTSRGWRWVLPQDPYLFFMMHAPSTEVDIYMEQATTEVDWYVLDDELGVGKVLAFRGAQKLTAGDKALDHIPANIQAQIEKDSKANDFVWFSYTTNQSNYLNMRDKETGMPVEVSFGGDEQVIGINMPRLSEIVEDAARCVTVNEYSTVPVAETVYYAVRVPKGFEITWKYDDGEKTSYAHAGTKIQSPFDEPSRANCDFNGWNDVNGKRVTTMPAEDITLYPDFSFQLRDVNWVCGGQTTTTKIPYGDRIVDHVPFVKMDGHDVKWYTTDDFTKQNDS